MNPVCIESRMVKIAAPGKYRNRYKITHKKSKLLVLYNLVARYSGRSDRGRGQYAEGV